MLRSPCVGGFETRPYEDRSGVNHIPGTAAPQCGKSGIETASWIETAPGIETVLGLSSFLGPRRPSAASAVNR